MLTIYRVTKISRYQDTHTNVFWKNRTGIESWVRIIEIEDRIGSWVLKLSAGPGYGLGTSTYILN